MSLVVMFDTTQRLLSVIPPAHVCVYSLHYTPIIPPLGTSSLHSTHTSSSPSFTPPLHSTSPTPHSHLTTPHSPSPPHTPASPTLTSASPPLTPASPTPHSPSPSLTPTSPPFTPTSPTPHSSPPLTPHRPSLHLTQMSDLVIFCPLYRSTISVER